MSTSIDQTGFGRRQLFRYAGGAAVVAVAAGTGIKLLEPFSSGAVSAQTPMTGVLPDMFLGGTDGWIGLPKTPAIAPFHPDPMAMTKGTDLTTYIFGFRNITDLSETQRFAQKEHAQHSAPLFWVDEFDDSPPEGVRRRHHQPRARGAT